MVGDVIEITSPGCLIHGKVGLVKKTARQDRIREFGEFEVHFTESYTSIFWGLSFPNRPLIILSSKEAEKHYKIISRAVGVLSLRIETRVLF